MTSSFYVQVKTEWKQDHVARCEHIDKDFGGPEEEEEEDAEEEQQVFYVVNDETESTRL
jgi:hypothetical protein